MIWSQFLIKLSAVHFLSQNANRTRRPLVPIKGHSRIIGTLHCLYLTIFDLGLIPNSDIHHFLYPYWLVFILNKDFTLSPLLSIFYVSSVLYSYRSTIIQKSDTRTHRAAGIWTCLGTNIASSSSYLQAEETCEVVVHLWQRCCLSLIIWCMFEPFVISLVSWDKAPLSLSFPAWLCLSRWTSATFSDLWISIPLSTGMKKKGSK